MSVSTYGQKVLIDAGDRRHSVQSNAPTTIWLVGDQNEIVRALAHVEQCFELTLRKETSTRNVPYGVLGDALRIEDDVRRELAHFGRDARPHLVCDEHREPPVMVRAHMAANALEELRLGGLAIFLGRVHQRRK